MHHSYRQILAVFISALFAFSPLYGSSAELVGVANATGSAEMDGVLLPSGSSVFSGARLRTGPDSTLTLLSSPEERINLASESLARFLKDGDTTVVALEKGMVDFRSAGRTRAVIESFGIEVRPNGNFSSSAKLALMNSRQAQVSVLQGSVEVTAPDQGIVLQAGQSALITASDAGPSPSPDKSPAKKRAIAFVIFAAASAAIAIPLALREETVSPTRP